MCTGVGDGKWAVAVSVSETRKTWGSGETFVGKLGCVSRRHDQETWSKQGMAKRRLTKWHPILVELSAGVLQLTCDAASGFEQAKATRYHGQ